MKKTWQIGPTVLPLKLEEGSLISSRCVADLERWKVNSRHRHTPAANQSCYCKTNRFSCILKQEPWGTNTCAHYGDVTSRVKKKFEEIMEANMWLSDLLLDRVPVKQSQVVHLNGFDM